MSALPYYYYFIFYWLHSKKGLLTCSQMAYCTFSDPALWLAVWNTHVVLISSTCSSILHIHLLSVCGPGKGHIRDTKSHMSMPKVSRSHPNKNAVHYSLKNAHKIFLFAEWFHKGPLTSEEYFYYTGSLQWKKVL